MRVRGELEEKAMKLLWGSVVYYILITSNLCIHGDAITLPRNVKFPAFLAFGDSVIDPGNNNYIPTIGRGNFPPYGRDLNGGVPTGRFSNGKVPSDFFAEELGIKELVPPYLDPTLQISDLLTGVSFASGACGYDPLSAIQINALSLDDQLDLFKQYINKLKAAVGENTTSTILSESMYLVCAGSNDITQTYSFRELHYTISSYTDFLLNKATAFVQELYKLGARRIGVVSIPPCGCLPAQRTVGGGLSRKCVDKQNNAAALFNNKLIHGLNSLNQKLLGSRFVYLDIYNPLLNMINNPSLYGFEVSNLGCCGTGKIEVTSTCNKFCSTCDDASKYVFWDAFHPTQKTYRILVQGLLAKNINEFF